MSPGKVEVLSRPAPGQAIQGQFHNPEGFVIHSSRSGTNNTQDQEFDGTVSWIMNGTGGEYLGWNATIGRDKVAVHFPPSSWGWNCREDSHRYLAVEFSQAKLGDQVDDSQFNAFAWWVKAMVLPTFPSIPMKFLMHSELAPGIRDGKTDLDPDGSKVRPRIIHALGLYGIQA